MIFAGLARQCTHYCGRPNYYAGVGKDLSVLGNPFLMEHSLDRDRVCDEYENYFFRSLELDPEFATAVDTIVEDYRNSNGKHIVLGCFCKPKKRCHCDTIVNYVKSVVDGESVNG